MDRLDFLSIKTDENFSLKNKLLYVLFLTIFTYTVIFTYDYINKINALIFFAACALVFSLILNFKAIYIFFVISFFINIVLVEFKVSVLYAFFLFSSFLITQKFEIKEFKNPLTYPIIFYLICCIPSFLNNHSIIESLYTSLNFLMMLILFYITFIYFDNYSKYSFPFKTFLIFSFLNASVVIITVYLTQKRVFGFAGVMFVDYVHLAIIMSLAFVLFKHGLTKFLNILLILLLALSSVLMQTRNAWIAFIATIFTFFPYIIIKSPKFGLNRKKIIVFCILLLSLMSITVVISSSFNVGLSERVENLQASEDEAISESGVVANSLISRLLIWHTAWNGFTAHPYIGIGFYSFAFNAKYYYTIPDLLFDRYVDKRTPHVGYLAVLTETGILGFIGFLVFIFYVLKIAYKSAEKSKKKEEIFYSQILLWCLVYITFSLFLTDAWLWGSGIMVWGTLMGLSTANYKHLFSNI